MSVLLEKIEAFGIVPVVVIQDVNHAILLADALVKGGLPVAEVTFRSKAAKESIRAMKTAYPEMIVGAGTVLTIQQVDEAIEAKAEFIVSPGFNPVVVEYCINKGIVIIPGVSSASQVEQALSYGLTTLKFFPAEAVGGLPLIKALSAPYPHVRFMPTGGLNTKNFMSYLNFKSVIAVGGSWMVSPELLENNQFDQIQNLTKEAIMLTHGFDLAHIGINQNSKTAANQLSQSIASLFGFEVETLDSSDFLHKNQQRIIEVMFTPTHGQNGHVAIYTHNVSRAMAYLTALGVTFIEDSKRFDKNGNIKSIYLKQEMGGFAFHLVQR